MKKKMEIWCIKSNEYYVVEHYDGSCPDLPKYTTFVAVSYKTGVPEGIYYSDDHGHGRSDITKPASKLDNIVKFLKENVKKS